MEFIVLFMVTLFVDTIHVHCQSFNDAKAVHEKLAQIRRDEGSTLLNIIPVEDQTSPLVVLLTMQLYSVDGFDPVPGQVHITGSVYMEWTDETKISGTRNVSFPYEEQGYTVPLSLGEIWVPDIRLTNAVGTVMNAGDPAHKVRYHVHDGRMLWLTKVIIRSSCSPSVKHYPFDRQECSFVYTPWGYTSNEILLEMAQSDWELCQYEENGMWSLLDTWTEQYTEHNQSYVKFHFTIQRQPLFVIMSTVLPVCLVSVLNVFVFLIPANSGERVTFGITCFLALVFMLQTTLVDIPHVAQPLPFLCLCLLVMLSISATVNVFTIFVHRLHNRPPRETAPKWLQNIVRLISCHCFKSLFKKFTRRNQIDSDPPPGNPINC